MLRNLIRRIRHDDKPYDLYAGIVAQARQPAFYDGLGVADTLEGRFDMIVLHVVLVMRRLRADGDVGRDASHSLFNVFFDDMDRNLREMGVSDLAVPKRIRTMGEAFYGRAAAYDTALDEKEDSSLRAALQRNLFGGAGAEAALREMAGYVRACQAALEATSAQDVLAGRIQWPAPAGPGGSP